ncbi:cytochrome P450 [Luteithermobacter gelatinilyticus]|uniref:cytochrome P450 n=1 Tax=Luteithermobacter gelatinilyticus TaxID=2582913 RepID=UPI0011067396|nr:cytochrome P450 [Luteithermobacter gelatinilyticus]|tara:strand:- start:1944 stop:3209 length:1266 start_codon:yes stop_codon:yes gene_type:complete
MSVVEEKAVENRVSFDPHSEEFLKNPYPAYKELREKAPVAYWREGRAWLMSDYEDVVRIQSDSRFSINLADWKYYDPGEVGENKEWDDLKSNDLLALSGLDHNRVRRLIMPSFQRGPLQKYKTIIENIVAQKIDTLRDREVFDVVHDFAYDIPVQVMQGLLGIPFHLHREFQQFAVAYVELFDPSLDFPPEEVAEKRRLITNGVRLVREVIERQRRQIQQGRPAETILEHLILACDQEDRLSDDELVALVGMVMAGGSESTIYLICNAVLNLMRFPQQRQILEERPELWDNAIMEVLRYDFFMKMGVPRYALEDVEWKGCRIGKGEMVYPISAAAQFCPEVFPRPDVFDVTRDTSKVIAFGRSKHICVGQFLAIMESRIAVSMLFEHFPDLTLVSEPVYDEHNKVLRALKRFLVHKQGGDS